MTDTPNPDKPAEADRIAKVIARAGIASRREAERMVVEGRVSVNGEKIASPALDVLPTDRITVDGKPLDAPQDTRLWLYYKPVGLVTTESDEKGRQTVFDALPRDLPRVMSIGRLDLNSEGLLLLTNDGELKRRLELPSTGWLRRYRVRVNGVPTDLTFDPLRRGATIDGEDLQPMEIRLDSQQGANAWLTVGIREGRNREIRRAMAHVGLQVNRLIRIGYGPFKLTGMEENEVREVKRRVLRDQLGGLLTGEAEDKPRDFRERGADQERPRRDSSDGRPRREDGPRRPRSESGDEGRPFRRRDEDGARPFRRRDDEAGGRKPRFDKGERGDRGDRKPFARRDDDGPARPFRDRGEDGPRKPRFDKGGFDKGDGARPFRRRDEDAGKPFRRREDEGGASKPRFGKSGPGGRSADGPKPYRRRDEDGPAHPAGDRSDAPRKPRWSSKPGPRREGEGDARREGGGGFGKRDWGNRDGGQHAGGNRDGGKQDGGKPRRDGGKPGGFAGREGFGGRDGGKLSFGPRNKDGRPGFKGKPGPGRGPKPGGGKPGGGRPGGGKPGFGGRPGGGKPRAPRG